MSGSRHRDERDTKNPTAVVGSAPVVDRERCKGCGLCVEFCPFGHLHIDEELNVAGYHPADVDPAEQGAALAGSTTRARESFAHNFAFWCLRCRYCEIVCPDAAIRVSGDVTGLEGVGDFEDGADE